MKILSLETSTDRASVAYCVGERVLWSGVFEAHRALSSGLALRVAEAVCVGGRPDSVAVGVGPGSYAGVRVAISTAVGLAAVWGCGLVGVASVAAFAPMNSAFQVIGDARRGAWYYSQVEGGVCTRGPRLAASLEQLQAWLAAGTGPVWSSDSCESAGVAVLRGFPEAERIGFLAACRRGVLFEGDLEPLYLREASITRPAC